MIHEGAGVAATEILDEMFETGMVTVGDDSKTKLSSGIDRECGAFLERVIREKRPKTALEVGLAFGVSTLFILRALKESGGERLIGMDPAQHDDMWRGGGLHNITRSGLADLYEFYEKKSEDVLPDLKSNGTTIDFAFIDGWHTFDHVLVDFFNIDSMLRTGGVVVFDDVGYPAIRRVCEFVLTNRDYVILDKVDRPSSWPARRRVVRAAKEAARRLLRTDTMPSAAAQAKIWPLRHTIFLALEKAGEDQRRWDHFVQF